MHKIIIKDNKICQFITNDMELFNSLKKFLSYKMVGVEYTEAYQKGWNGITYLINKKGTFFSGLLNKVSKFLKENGELFEIEDQRKTIQINTEIDLSESLKSLKMIPRDYQERIVNISSNNRKGIIRACTGSGKTLCTALITAKLNKPTIIYVIGLDLLEQFHKLFSTLFNEKIGYIGDGVCDIQRINIATIWTIGRSLNLNKKNLILDDDNNYEEKYNESQSSKIINLLNNTKVHIFDECHIVTCGTIQSIYKKIDPEYIYGFSGTPYRDDNTDLLSHAILGEQIVNVSASELIEKKVLAQPIIKFETVPSMRIGSNQYQTVYKKYIVENESRNNLILKNTKDLLNKGYTPLVLFKQIKHGNKLHELFTDSHIKCEMLYGNDSLNKRLEVKELLNNKKIDLILASTIFDLGVDIPLLNALVLTGSGKSSIRALQRIGRVIRPYPGKKFAAIVDFYDQVKFLKNHSKIRYNIYSSENGFKILKSDYLK